jgi:DNA-binding CsgD family transcriptional regulator
VETNTAKAPGTLLERDEELARIDAGLDAAAQGHGSLLLIQGPAGIGKSELLREARSRARHAGLEVLAARGGEFEQSFGFGVVRQLLDARLADAGPPERDALLQGAASLAAPALALAPPEPELTSSMPVGDPAAAIQHGLHWLVANLAERTPVLISVDDLHWADAASVRWFVYLARRLADLPALFVAAVRSGEPGPEPQLIATLAGEEVTQVLQPAALSEAANAELVRLELGAGADDGFCVACHRTTGGNPFLLTELIEAVRQDGIPPTEESVARIEELGPETISRSVLLRMARLPEGAEPLTRAIAILGGEAELRHAVSLAELDEDGAAGAADALTAAGILAPGRPFRFVHPLIRAAVYSQIPEAERALAHYRAARVLADEGGNAEEVAAQLLHAEPAGNAVAVEALRAAAADATLRAAPDAAVAYLRRALAEPPRPGVRTELLAELIEAAVLAADLTAFEGISDDPVAELSRDSETLMATAPSLAAWLFFGGRLEEMTEVMERGTAALNDASRSAEALRAESLALSVIDIQPPEAVARLEGYADRLEAGTTEERAWFAMRGWWQHFLGGPASDSVAFARRGLEDGLLLEAAPVAPVVGQAILVLLRADELDEAESWIDLLVDHARRLGPVHSTIAFGLRGYLSYRRGDLAGAEDDSRTAVELCREHRIGFGLAVNLRWLLDALIDCGELADAEAELESSGLDGPLPDYWWFGPLRFGRARLRIASGRIEDGIRDLRGMLHHDGATRPASDPVASTLALALHSLDREPDEVRRLLEWELAAAHEWGTPRGIGIALRANGLVEGGERGIELLQEAAEVLARSPARLEHAQALADLGAALRRAKRRADAREPLREALEMAHGCGAAVIEETARVELVATGARPRRVMRTGVASLTPSEMRAARMAAEGMENREIAQRLFLSVKTVETHLGHVYGKLGISSRRALPEALRE